MWTLIVVISLLVLVGSLAGLLFKNTRGKAKRYAWMSALAMIIAGGFLASEQDDEARRLGFSDNDDRRAATEAGVTDPAAAWRAAKEAKKPVQQATDVQTPAGAATTPQASSGRVEADAGHAINGRASGAKGRARVCATKDVEFDSYREIKLPATTVFKDSGPLTRDVRDPWRPDGPAGNDRRAAIMTTEPVRLTKTKPCAETGVRMLVGKQFKESSASAADRRVWQIDDVLEYSPLAGRPPVEFGKLIDDISVRAVLLSDAGDPLILARDETNEALKAATCLAEAQKVAAHERGTVGRQTGSVVFISHPAASEFSFGCGIDGIKPDLFTAWNKSRPQPSTVKLITSAGAFLTGAPTEDIKQELTKCINEALKPDSGELSSREFDGGARVECQAFERDGGGGSATILRRFGSYPAHEMPSGKVLDEMRRASAALAAVEDAEAARSVEFAKWWLDPAIPTKVKTFMMITARVQALADRCPTWRPNYAVITDAAVFAGVSVQDIEPGGRYFDTFADMLAGMKKGTETESREEACTTAKKNYGEASGR
jgi:hypothetical protein